MLEIPVQYFFMYGFWVFKAWWWLLLVLYGLIMLSFLLAGFYGARRRLWLDGSKPKDLAVALRETQLSFIEDEDKRLRNPKIWAPFVLVEAQ